MKPSGRDRTTLRTLAARWIELAAQPVMAKRRRQWTALKDLRPERPMVLFETSLLENYVDARELVCTDPDLRAAEHRLRLGVRHAEEVNDDLVLEPRFLLYWDIEQSDYGVPIDLTHATDAQGGSLGYHFNHPLRTPEDVRRLKPRTRRVDRAKTLARQRLLGNLFGDILPVQIRGTGGLLASLTSDLFRLVGNDNLLTWPFDAPEALRTVVAFLRDDRLALYGWMEREGLLGLNNDDHLVGSGSPGYTTALPSPGFAGAARLRDIWMWMESQETTMISPAMFADFFLPAMKDIAALFGLIYYGCCEPVHDRWHLVGPSMPHIRAVSISPWCDQRVMAERLGKTRVFSRKPKPWLISGASPDWHGLEKDLDETIAAARDGCLEIICRDVYRIDGDRPRLRRWTDLVRSRIG
jgi:hypothetical protein